MKIQAIKSQLYLASQSSSRNMLLQSSQIPFSLLTQDAEESQCSLSQPLEQLVRQLALLKMKHVKLPIAEEGSVAFFLTADTMTRDSFGQLLGKPVDREDAIRMLKSCRKGAVIGTAFCLERKIFQRDIWITQKTVVGYDQASCVVNIPDAFLDFYLDRVSFMHVSGGIAIEGFGDQFVSEVKGSYSAILGLPMYKIRQALYDLGFYDR